MTGGITLSALKTSIEVNIKDFKNKLNEAATAGVSAAKDMSKKMSSAANVGKTLEKAGATMTKAFTVPLAGASVACGKFYMDAENSFAKVNTIMDQTKVSNAELHKQVVKASNDTGVAVTDFNEALYSSVSAGVDSGKAIQFTTEMTKLAKGGFTSTESAVDVVTTALNAYGLGADQATAVSDKLITTQNLGKTTVNELASSMGRVIPTANSYGVNLDNVCASLADLTKNGIATAEATTYYNSMLNELGSSGTKVSDVIKEKMGASFTDLMNQGVPLTDVLKVVKDSAEESGMSLGDMFGSSEAAKAALTIMKDDGVEYNQILKDMESSAGATDKAFKTMDDTPLEQLKKALNELKNAGIEFGEKMAPAIKIVTDIIKELGNRLASLSPEQQEFIIKAGLVVVAVGPVVSIIGKMITVFTQVAPVVKGVGTAISNAGGIIKLLTGPVGIAIAIIGSLITVGVLLYKNWDTIKEKAGQLKDWISEKWNQIKTAVTGTIENIKTSVTEKFQQIWQKITDIFSQIKETVQTAWETVKNIVTVALMAIGEIISAAFEIITLPFRFIWENCKDFIITAWEAIKNTVSEKLEAIKMVISEVWNAVIGFLSPIFENIKNAVSETWNAVKDTISAVLERVKEIIHQVWEGIKEVVSNAVESVKEKVSAVFNAVKETVTSIWNGIKNTISSVADGIKSKVSSVFNTVKTAISEPLESAKSIVSNIFTSIKNSITDKIDGAKNAVKNAIDKIRSFFNFSWSLPRIKLPHFSISGSFSLDPPRIPRFSVSWYKNGAIMDGSTIFGMNGGKLLGGGEAGKEAILPLDGFYEKLNRIFDERLPRMGSGELIVNIEKFENNREQDVRAFAKELEFYRQQVSLGGGV